jgi:TPR repeat protein
MGLKYKLLPAVTDSWKLLSMPLRRRPVMKIPAYVSPLSHSDRNRSAGWFKPALITLLILATPTDADVFGTAMAEAAAGNYGAAAAGFHKLAEKGDAEAAHNLAILFASGRGLPQNSVEAAFWAWRARLAGLLQAAPLANHLMQDLTADRQAMVADRLEAALAPAAEAGDGAAMLALAAVLSAVRPQPDTATAHAWQSIAAALDVPGSIAARNATLEATAPEHRQKAQDQALTAFQGWCGRQAPKAPAACSAVTD